jgi:hypothetical protein
MGRNLSEIRGRIRLGIYFAIYGIDYLNDKKSILLFKEKTWILTDSLITMIKIYRLPVIDIYSSTCSKVAITIAADLIKECEITHLTA